MSRPSPLRVLIHFRGLPPLDPGTLPPSYITFGESRYDAPSAIRDLDVERVMESSSSRSIPTPPAPPPELTKSGKPLTKREKKAVCDPYLTEGLDIDYTPIS